MTVSSLSNPSVKDAIALIETGIEDGEMITVVGKCIVDYEGRTNSFLPAGERLVVLKPDGTLLVHQTTKRTPVNWQPPGCIHRVENRDGNPVIVSTRTDPKEIVEIRFETVLQVSTLDLSDGRSLDLTGTEEDLKQEILNEPSMLEEGFTPQEAERWSIAGPADVYGEDTDGHPVIVELKRRRTGPDAVSQLKRYVDEFVRETSVDESDVRGVLVAPSVTENAEELLEREGLELVRLEPPEESRTSTSTLSDFTSE